MYFSLLDQWDYPTVEAVRSRAVGKNVFGSGERGTAWDSFPFSFFNYPN